MCFVSIDRLLTFIQIFAKEACTLQIRGYLGAKSPNAGVLGLQFFYFTNVSGIVLF